MSRVKVLSNFLCGRRFALENAKYLSTNLNRKPLRNPKECKLLSKLEEEAFLAQYPKILEEALHKDVLCENEAVKLRLKKLFEHYLPYSKFLRQHILIYLYKAIEEHFGTFNQANMAAVYRTAWLLEISNTHYMLLDDILDKHDFRRGRPTWQTFEGIGITSTADILVVQYILFQLTKKYYSKHKHYTRILENVTDTTPFLGMLMELETKSMDDFKWYRIEEFIRTKATFFLYYQPVELATLLADKCLTLAPDAKKLFDAMSYLYFTQNDLLDCYGAEVTGKPGTDIQMNRCSILITLALSKASPQQKKILEECYGSFDTKKIEAVKSIYKEVNVVSEFYKLEEQFLDTISIELAKIKDDFSRHLLERLAYVFTFGEVGKPL